MYDQGNYIRLDQNVLKTSSEDEYEKGLQDVFTKTNVCWESNESIFSRPIKTNF